MTEYIPVMALSMAVALFVTPWVRRLALRLGAVDRPVARSVHTEPTPHLGGVAMYVAFALTAWLTAGFDEGSTTGLLLGGALILCLGILDDVKGISPRLKFLGQAGAALVLVAYGFRVEFVTNPLGGLVLLGSLSVPFTIMWVVAIVNVVNLADGLDGLAAGITAITSLAMLSVSLNAGQAYLAMLAAALAGSTLGFLPYNFNPARIFMGDAGAMFLGYTLAALAIEGTMKSATTIALVVPVLALGLPIFDTSMAILRRYVNGKPIAQADREHLHHRLLEFGLTQRQAVLIMYLISGCLGLTSVILAARNFVAAAVLLLAVAGFTLGAAKKVGFLDLRRKG